MFIERILEPNSLHQQNSKQLGNFYGSNELLNSYRYSSGQSGSNATVTSSNVAEMQKNSLYSFQSSILPSSPSTSVESSSSIALTPPTHHNFSTFSKHWIWNRNIFYSNIANSTNYLSYLNANGNSNLLNSPSVSNKSEPDHSSSPAQCAEINSDDSLDNQSINVSF